MKLTTGFGLQQNGEAESTPSPANKNRRDRVNNAIKSLQIRKAQLESELLVIDDLLNEMVQKEKAVNTPLKRQSLIAWAQDQVDRQPSVCEEVWDDNSQSWVNNIVANSSERVLCLLMKRIEARTYAECDKAELVDEIIGLFANGVERPWSKMSVDDLVSEILESVWDDLDIVSLEELLRQTDRTLTTDSDLQQKREGTQRPSH